jgi:hypothetical protein
MPRFLPLRSACACLALLAIPSSLPQAKPAVNGSAASLPAGETLSYSIEWRMIYAGSARLSFQRQKNSGPPAWESNLHLESGGLVSRLYKIEDNYHVDMLDQFCATGSVFDAVEGKRHHETKVTFDRNSHKAVYLETDLLKHAVIKSSDTEIPACVSDVIGGLYKLRTVHLDPGQSMQVPLSDGKKTISAKVEAQEREEVETKAGKFKTIRYEAYIFNGTLFKKNARLQFWMTDDAAHLPVQLRARMPFPIGTITFLLDKDERI